jgi:glycosyltransferase involved in cell wall biosynthesis
MNLSKILIIVPSFNSGGTVSSLINFVSLVDKQKFDICVFAITNTGSSKMFVSEHCTIVGESFIQGNKAITSIKGNLRTRIFAFFKVIKKLLEKIGVDISPMLFKIYAKRLDTGEYDYVLVFQEGQATLLGSFFKNGTKVAWVRSEYTRFVKEVGDKYNACYQNYDKVVSISRAALSSFLSVLPQYHDKAYVQYNFLNDGRILSLSNEKVNDLWDNDVFTIVSLGRIDPVKRISEIPRLCRDMLDMGLQFRWIIIGGIAVKDEYSRLIDNIEKYSVQDNVIILGNRPNPYPYLKHCNLLVSLSISETFNNTLTEAKILGIPVVTTNYPCAFESINNSIEGLIVAFEEIVPAITDMIEDKAHIYSSIKEHLSSYQYDKEKLLQQLYTNVLSNGG